MTISLKKSKPELLSDPDVKREYDALCSEFEFSPSCYVPAFVRASRKQSSLIAWVRSHPQLPGWRVEKRCPPLKPCCVLLKPRVQSWN